MKTSRTTSFDGWVLRADVGELARDDRKIRLQQRPLLVLQELLANPGELVTREQLIARLWPQGVVDFDTGLNTAVRKLRVALDDVGEIPRYIETLPRKGYRFIGSIDPPPADVAPQAAPLIAPIRPPSSAEPPSAPPPPVPPQAVPPTSPPPAPVTDPRRRFRYAFAVVLAATVCGLIFFARTQRDGASSSSAPPATVSETPRTDGLSIALLPLKAAKTAEPDETLAKIASDLLRQRLGRLDKVVAINATSMPRSDIDREGLRQFGASVHARYLLDGKVARTQDQMHVELELLDAGSGERLWSFDEDRAAKDLSGLIGEAVRGVAGRLHVRATAIPDSVASAPINLDAYGVYLRAQDLMDNVRIADAQAALELFRRATVLDPGFARAYVGLAQALQLSSAGFGGKTEAEQDEAEREANVALDRALALDPGLGEALIQRARHTRESVEAEKLFREGLRLAPNYGVGYQRYAEFLFDEYRRGEAIEAMDRARAVEPLKPRLHLRQALFRMETNSDVPAHDRLVREALAINPKLVLGLMQLADSRYQYSGEFADGIRLLEQAIQLDPRSAELKGEVVRMYLDVDDPDAALTVLKESEGASKALVEIAQYQRDRRRAAQLAQAVPLDHWRYMWAAPEASALRDEAIVTGDFALALDRMGTRFAISVPWGEPKTAGPRLWNRGLGLVYAHTLVSAGETQRGRKLAESILAQLDGETVGRAQFFLSRDRAAAFTILGDKERALDELKNSLSIGHYYSWWYLGELDPLYEALRADPRFRALVVQAKQHRVRQRALLDELRRTGQVPRR